MPLICSIPVGAAWACILSPRHDLRASPRAVLGGRVASRDSGKAMLDAVLGEVVVTCEKIHWLCDEGERWLRPERRSPGRMSFFKAPRVEYCPVGVVGARQHATAAAGSTLAAQLSYQLCTVPAGGEGVAPAK